jgi:hypothetical protein
MKERALNRIQPPQVKNCRYRWAGPYIAVQQISVKAQQITTGAGGIAHTVRQWSFPAVLAACSRLASSACTSSASKYSPVRWASSRAASPRATNSRWSRRLAILSRSDASMNEDRLSFSLSTSSAALRSSGSTRSAGIVAVLMTNLFVSHLRYILPAYREACATRAGASVIGRSVDLF